MTSVLFSIPAHRNRLERCERNNMYILIEQTINPGLTNHVQILEIYIIGLEERTTSTKQFTLKTY